MEKQLHHFYCSETVDSEDASSVLLEVGNLMKVVLNYLPTEHNNAIA